MVEVEALLGKCIKDVTKRKAKKAVGVAGETARLGIGSAGDVVRYAVERGWVL